MFLFDFHIVISLNLLSNDLTNLVLYHQCHIILDLFSCNPLFFHII